jgi:hypothetical protein
VLCVGCDAVSQCVVTDFLQGSAVILKGNCLTLKVEALQSLEVPGATHQ